MKNSEGTFPADGNLIQATSQSVTRSEKPEQPQTCCPPQVSAHRKTVRSSKWVPGPGRRPHPLPCEPGQTARPASDSPCRPMSTTAGHHGRRWATWPPTYGTRLPPHRGLERGARDDLRPAAKPSVGLMGRGQGDGLGDRSETRHPARGRMLEWLNCLSLEAASHSRADPCRRRGRRTPALPD